MITTLLTIPNRLKTTLAATLTPPATLTAPHLDAILVTKAQLVHRQILIRLSGLTKHTVQTVSVTSLILTATPLRLLSIHLFQSLLPSPSTNLALTTVHAGTKSLPLTKTVPLLGGLGQTFLPKPLFDDSTDGFPTESKLTSSTGNSTSQSLTAQSIT